MVNGHEVDFLWPELELVVEADGLRFSHHRVKHEPAYVQRILDERPGA